MKTIRIAFILLPLILFSIKVNAQQSQPSQRNNENNAGPVPEKVVALFNDISDIDKLRVLNPLNLTSDQLNKMIALISKEEDAYNKRLAQEAVPPIDAIAQQIKDVKAKMLKGGNIPADFDDQVKELQSNFVKQRKNEDNRTLLAIIDGMKQIFTQEQVRTAVMVVKQLTKFAPDTTSDQYFNYYVLGTFVEYPRIVPLLKEMVKARSDSSSGAQAAPSTPSQEPAQ